MRTAFLAALLAAVLPSGSRGAVLPVFQPSPSPALDQTKPASMLQPRTPPPLSIHAPLVPHDAALGVVQATAQERTLLPVFANSATTVTPEITELARGLKNDPRLEYEFVRNNILYMPVYGSVKGATMTYLDGRGNDFDQASLLIALLRASGFSASYIYGQIQLSAAQISNWLGVAADATVVGTVLGSGGIPATTFVDGSGNLVSVQLDHVWVQVTVNSNSVAFDPSFKGFTDVAGINLSSAMGYSQSSFLSDAAQGMTNDPNYVQNPNRTNIRADLATFATNLVSYIKANNPGATLGQVVGGRSINVVRGAAFQAALPYEVSRTYTWTDIPQAFQTTLTVQHLGINLTLNTVDFYGTRFTISYDGTFHPILSIDGTQVAYGNAATQQINPCVLIINHPYAANGGTYGDQTLTVYPSVGGVFYISSSWGGTGRALIEKHRHVLDTLRAQGGLATSEPVLGETLAMIGLSWMAEVTQAARLGDRIDGTITLMHHEMGLVGQTNAPFMDMPGSFASVLSKTGDSARATARSVVRNGISSGFEWGAIDQMQPGGAVSTVKLLDEAASEGNKIFDATSANFAASVEPNLVGYDSYDLGYVQSYINAGYRLIMPQHGDLVDGAYHGFAFIAISPSGGMAHIIVGGLKGGSGTTIENADPDEARKAYKLFLQSLHHDHSFDPVDHFTGALQYASTDLSLGGESKFPWGLEFKTMYDSSSNLTDGPLGLGWSHVWELTAGVESDGSRGMGDASAADAAAAISELYVASDMVFSGLAEDRLVFATLGHRWFIDNLVRSMVNVSIPGETIQFEKLADGAYNPPPGTWSQLTTGAGGTTLTTMHGETASFNTDGNLTTWKDANNNTVTLTYDASKRLQTISNGLGRTFTLTYDGNSHITSVSDGTGRTVGYAYDASHRLMSVTDPLGHAVTFGYDSSNRLSTIYKPSAPSTPITTNVYDSLGRVMTQADVAGDVTSFYYGGDRNEEDDPGGFSHVMYFSPTGQLLTDIDKTGHTVTDTYDGQQRLVQTTFPEGNGLSYGYDSHSNAILQTTFPKTGSGRSPIVEHWTYDPTFNRMTSYTDGAGRVTSYSYDSKGNLMRIDLPNGGGPARSIVYTRNARGQHTSETHPDGTDTTYTYDSATAELMSMTVDPGGLNRTTSFTRDNRGGILTRTDPRGYVHTYQYDLNRRLTQETSPPPSSFQTQYVYDADDNEVTERRQTGDGGHPWQTTTRTFTLDGLLATQSGPTGDTMTRQYDVMRRLWKATDATGATWQFLYDPEGRLATTIGPSGMTLEQDTYTPNGRRATQQDANGNTKTTIYDDFDRISEMDGPGAQKITYYHELAGDPDRVTRKEDALGGQTLFSYDGIGQPIQTTDADGVMTHYTFDAMSRVLTTADGVGNVTHYVYDAVGNLVSRTDPLGHTWHYMFDPEDRLVETENPDTSTQTETFNELGRLVTSTDGVGRVTEYQYDPLGRRTAVTSPDGGVVSATYDLNDDQTSFTDPLGHSWASTFGPLNRMSARTDPRGLSEHYQYDSMGRTSQKTTRDGKVLTYTYDPGSRLSSVALPDGEGTVNYGHDGAGNVTSVQDAGGTTIFAYDAANRKAGLMDPLGNGVGLAYTPAGRLAAVTYPRDHVVNYQYDAAGRLSSINDWLGGVTTIAYDAASRMTQMIFPNGTKKLIGYDANGRTTSIAYQKSDSTVLLSYQLSYNPASQLTSRVESSAGVVSAPPPGQATFAYDAGDRLTNATINGEATTYTFDDRGNLLTRTQGSSTTTLTYDDRDRIITSTGGGVSISNEYDPTGTRIMKTVGGVQTRYLADVHKLYCQLNASNAVQLYFVSAGPLILYAIDSSGHRSVLFGDERGSVEMVTDDSQAIVASYDFGPYGTTSALSGSFSANLHFVGAQGVVADENGLHLMTSRYYDPETGRFTREDPLGPSPGSNLYTYADAEPTDRVDPAGTFAYGINVPTEEEFKQFYDGHRELVQQWLEQQQQCETGPVLTAGPPPAPQPPAAKGPGFWAQSTLGVWWNYFTDSGDLEAASNSAYLGDDGVVHQYPAAKNVAIEVAGNIGPVGKGFAVVSDGSVVVGPGLGVDNSMVQSRSLKSFGIHVAIVVPSYGKDVKTDVLKGFATTVEGGYGAGGGVIFGTDGQPEAVKFGLYTPGFGGGGSWGGTTTDYKNIWDQFSQQVSNETREWDQETQQKENNLMNTGCFWGPGVGP